MTDRIFKIYGNLDYKCRSSPKDLGELANGLKEGQYNLNPSYQREYVWGEKEQQEFLSFLFKNKPIGTICIVVDDSSKDVMWMEVVDGKQRMTTILKFFENEIDYDGYYWDDLSEIEQRFIRRIIVPCVILQDKWDGVVDEEVKLQYFYDINFAGVPQSEEHKQKVIGMMKK